MTPQPHPQRCETCMRRIGLIDGSDDCPIGIPYHTDVAEAYVTEKIGCASHSARQEALDRIWQYFIDNDCEVRENNGQKNYWVSSNLSISGLMELVDRIRSQQEGQG